MITGLWISRRSFAWHAKVRALLPNRKRPGVQFPPAPLYLFVNSSKRVFLRSLALKILENPLILIKAINYIQNHRIKKSNSPKSSKIGCF